MMTERRACRMKNQTASVPSLTRRECMLSLRVWSVVSLSMIVFLKPIKFAILFTFGNVLAVGSTAFLIGPEQQLNMMFDSTRLYATAAYLGFVVIALISALWIHNKILTILAIICEICALIWYSLSYIPFARRMVSELMVRFCDTEL
ncbi:vesicle transport protein SFT2B isoform X2 [Pistacia vera]|uniref:vesicle transport protein SFT2B isoform X2 n=1 Tax=Pistacia vera TaxID=55513 RepID=UPI00126340CE|nr:vesicle transport protein SFT2B isoform X2 [Pistacia vera]